MTFVGIYEILIPMNVEHKFYHACLMSDIDIYDEYELSFSGYFWLKKTNLECNYAVFSLETVEEKAQILYNELNKIVASYFEMYLVDVIEEEDNDV